MALRPAATGDIRVAARCRRCSPARPRSTRTPRRCAWAGCRGFPTFDRNPLDLADEAAAAGVEPAEHVVAELKAGRLGFAVDDPSAPSSFPRVFFVWRSNLLGSSGKGQEYFLRHLLGVDPRRPARRPAAAGRAPRLDVRWRDEIPRGKLDLLVNVDFRMTTTGLYSDIVLPAATWYEKYDLSMTDMHPFVHSFNQAVPPPWEARTDWDAFGTIARAFSTLAAEHLGVRRDIVATPVLHDTPGEIAQPRGEVADWRAGECEPVPGRTMPALTVVERDYGAVAEQWAALGPLAETARLDASRARRGFPTARSRRWRRATAACVGGAADGRPSLERARAGRRGDARAVGRDERPPRGGGLPLAGGALRRAARRSRRGRRGDPHHVPRHAGAAAPRDHVAGVVGHRRGGPRVRGVHDQRRARQAVAHAVRPDAPLPRPRMDARARRGPARLPAADRPPADARRRPAGRQRRRRPRSRCAT